MTVLPVVSIIIVILLLFSATNKLMQDDPRCYKLQEAAPAHFELGGLNERYNKNRTDREDEEEEGWREH